MPFSNGFYEKTRFLSSLAKVLLLCGLIGIITSLLIGKQDILTGAAVLIGLGIALMFFRDAFRPKG